MFFKLFVFTLAIVALASANPGSLAGPDQAARIALANSPVLAGRDTSSAIPFYDSETGRQLGFASVPDAVPVYDFASGVSLGYGRVGSVYLSARSLGLAK